MERTVGKNRRWIQYTALAAAVLLLAMLLAACGSNDDEANGNANAGPQTEEAGHSGANAGGSGEDAASGEDAGNGASGGNSGTGAETDYPLTVTDATGVDITLDQAPERVVMLVPSDTEIVYAIGAGELAVGADAYSDYPPEAAGLPRVGDVNTNIEAVAALNPDLVLASSSMNAAAVDSLRQLGIKVYASDPQTLEETIAHIERLGVLLNRQAEAQAVTDSMRADMQFVADKVKDAEPVTVYLEFSPGWTVGTGTFLDDLVTQAGGVNIATAQPGWYEVDSEAVISQNPQVILYPQIDGVDFLEGILSRPGWEQIDAVKNDRVHGVKNDPLVRVGPRLTDGLLDIAAAIHPDLFP